MLLLSLLKWFRANLGEELQITAWTDIPGPRDDEFASIGSVRSFNPEFAHSPRWWNRLRMRFWWQPLFARWRAREVRLDSRNARVALVNTVANFPAIVALDARVPVVTFVHELEVSIRRLLTPLQIDWLMRRTSLFVVMSETAAKNLRDAHGIAPEAITKVRPWVEDRSVFAAAIGCRDTTRKELGIEVGHQLVVGCGYRDWIKGPDIFLELACLVRGELGASHVRFVWIGAQGDAASERFLESYRAHLGLEEFVQFRQAVPEPSRYFAAADVFALTSRAESFGLVALEAACSGTPVVYFKHAGGPAESLPPPMGIAVESYSTRALAEAVLALLNSPLADHERTVQSEKLLARHCINLQAPLISAVLQRLASSR